MSKSICRCKKGTAEIPTLAYINSSSSLLSVLSAHPLKETTTYSKYLLIQSVVVCYQSLLTVQQVAKPDKT